MPPATTYSRWCRTCALPSACAPSTAVQQPGQFRRAYQTDFGAADNLFPRVADPIFRTAEPVAFDPVGLADRPGTPTSYTQTSGFVFDSQLRTISNLIVDQTANNPAALPPPMIRARTASDFGAPGNDDVLKDGVHIVTSPGLDGQFGTADDSESSSSRT